MSDQLRIGILGAGLIATYHAEFVRAVLAGTPATPDFAEAVKAHRIIDAMYASAANGGDSISVAVDHA